LPPLPGYPGITIGGCIAFDVHGKNPAKHGTFRNWVHSLTLFHPEQGWIAADEGSNTEWLELACGGLGLTGLIVRARLKVKPLNGPTVQVRHMKVAGYQALLEILRERSPIDEFVYALARPGTLLRAPLASASVTLGNIAQGSVGPAPERKRDALLDPNGGDRKAPFTIFNDRTGAVSSLAFWLGTRLQDGSKSPISLDGFLFPFAGAHLYFKLFGRAGFREHQLLIPWASAAEFGRALAAALEKHRPPIALIALKAFDGPQSYLRFNGCGLSMVLDLPNVPGSARFSALLDELVVAHGGIPNIAKDSRLSSVTARQCYREFGRFENGVRSLPGGARSRSMVARRLGLLE
jgi:decaprenylphospho-beta-D-ribofuranose 2-oxidase